MVIRHCSNVDTVSSLVVVVAVVSDAKGVVSDAKAKSIIRRNAVQESSA
jgi:hypothetical protein